MDVWHELAAELKHVCIDREGTGVQLQLKQHQRNQETPERRRRRGNEGK